MNQIYDLVRYIDSHSTNINYPLQRQIVRQLDKIRKTVVNHSLTTDDTTLYWSDVGEYAEPCEIWRFIEKNKIDPDGLNSILYGACGRERDAICNSLILMGAYECEECNNWGHSLFDWKNSYILIGELGKHDTIDIIRAFYIGSILEDCMFDFSYKKMGSDHKERSMNCAGR